MAAPRWAMILSPLRAQVSARRWLAKVQFIEQRGGFFQNVADVSIAYQIFGTRVEKSGGKAFRLVFQGKLWQHKATARVGAGE